MAVPNPIALFEGLPKAGREWRVQKMLASLVLGDLPATYNTPRTPSDAGARLLRRLDAEAFGASRDDTPRFVFEFKLLAVEPNAENGWPDLAALWPDRVLLFELKTEPGSVRDGQVDDYLRLALHHYPERSVDLLYLTRDAVYAGPDWLPSRARYANLDWNRVADLLEELWDGKDAEDLYARVFADYLGVTLTPRDVSMPDVTSPQLSEGPSLDDALRLAELVAADGKQRAYPYPWATYEEAVAFRMKLKVALRNGGVVEPWVWRSRSKGRPLTVEALRTGAEVRLSPVKARPAGQPDES